jgi:tetratricopeptide (TPR) repeat protein
MVLRTIFWRRLGLILVNGIVLAALALWTLRPAPNDALRHADATRLAGNLRLATSEYQRLADAGQPSPAVLLHLLELRMLRGEWAAATDLLADLARQPLLPAEADTLALAQGWTALQLGDVATAAAAWDRVSAPSQGRANLLRGELALRSGDLISATERLNMVGELAEPWRTYAYYRAAQLNLAYAPATAMQLLSQAVPPSQPVAMPDLDATSLAADTARLSAAASLADPDARRVALARQWADEGLSRAARSVLGQIPASSLYASLARNEAAKLRWLSGDPAGALADITQATSDYPNVAELRRTQLTIAVANGDLATARTALEAAVQADGRSADNYVASAALEVANQNYNSAARAYDQAIQTAAVTGTYQLQAANFYVAVPLRVCSDGRNYAQQAIGSSVDVAARRLSAQLALRCNDPAATLGIIAPLLSQLPDDPQLLYLRGAARWYLGDRAAAAADLEQVANRAPGSLWMREAERLIGPP